MEAKGRALYNTLLWNSQEDPDTSFECWQVEDYREHSEETLFERLKELGVVLDKSGFIEYSANVASPEELTETLCLDDDCFEELYLILFEMWRRFLPDRPSMSIFCDQLDHWIALYDRGGLVDEEPLQENLNDLQRVLDENLDQGGDPQKIFSEIALYFAHDLESFIYDYAATQVDDGNDAYASELVEAFSPYILEPIWFDFLRLRLVELSNEEEAEVMLDRLLDELSEDPEFELILEVARYHVNRGSIRDFARVVKMARPLIVTEQDFQELVALTCEFYRLLDREEEGEAPLAILKERQAIDLDQPLAKGDPVIQQFYDLLEDFEWSEA